MSFGDGMRPRLGAVARLVVEELELGGVLEAGRGDLGGEVEVHRPRHAAPQLPEGIAGVFVHATRDDQPLAVLLQALGGRLLVARAGCRPRCPPCRSTCCWPATSSGVRAALAHAMAQIMSVKPGPLGARGDRDLAGDADERVGGVRHRALVPPAEGGNAGRGHGVDDRVVAGAGEERRDALFLAGAGEHLGAGHREVERLRRRGRGGRELGGHANGRDGVGRVLPGREGLAARGRSPCR